MCECVCTCVCVLGVGYYHPPRSHTHSQRTQPNDLTIIYMCTLRIKGGRSFVLATIENWRLRATKRGGEMGGGTGGKKHEKRNPILWLQENGFVDNVRFLQTWNFTCSVHELQARHLGLQHYTALNTRRATQTWLPFHSPTYSISLNRFSICVQDA